MQRRATMSFYVLPKVGRVIRDRAANAGSASGALARIVTRYAEILVREMPSLSTGESALISESLDGARFDAPATIALLDQVVADAIQMRGLAEKHGVDGPDLVKRLSGLTYAGKMAVLDSIELFQGDRQA
jgi:hypothetical protein